MDKTLSIALTTYNGGKFLRKQLDSIYCQTKLPDEVIVCDDGSIDDTINILEEYRQAKGLRYFINDNQLGVNRNFYKAISLCSCDYIALSDQDDIWLPTKLETTYNKLKELDGDLPVVVSSQAIDVDEECRYTSIKNDIKDYDSFFSTFININNSQGCSLMFNEVAKKIVLSTCNIFADKIYFDAYISYVAALLGVKYNIGKRLMLYRHHQNNVIGRISSNKMTFIQHIRVQHRFRHFMTEKQMELSLLVYDYHKDSVLNDAIHIFFERIRKIYTDKNKISCYITILSMPEYSFSQKMKIIYQTIIIDFIRLFV